MGDLGQFTHIELAIERGSEPICGSVTAGGERPRTFSGWIELTAAIERARLLLGESAERPPAVA